MPRELWKIKIMDLNDVKKFVNCNGERVILMEDGNPTMVLLSYEDYKKISNGLQNDTQPNLFDVSKNNDNKKQNRIENELTLEDLPF